MPDPIEVPTSAELRDMLRRELDAVRADRDQLLAALKNARATLRNNPTTECRRIVIDKIINPALAGR